METGERIHPKRQATNFAFYTMITYSRAYHSKARLWRSLLTASLLVGATAAQGMGRPGKLSEQEDASQAYPAKPAQAATSPAQPTTKKAADPQAAPLASDWLVVTDGPIVSFDEEGRLQYRADELGNTIPDFSRAGYQGGGVPIPEVSTVLTVEPIEAEADATARLQRAIDEVAALPANEHGHRGALLLKEGMYRVKDMLYVPGGVVLRGENSDEDGTVILATGTEQRPLIIVGDPDYKAPASIAGHPPANIGTEEIGENRYTVTDSYVPWSEKTLTLASTEGLSVGDRVIVLRPATEEWLAELGMDQLEVMAGNPGRKLYQWKPDEYAFHIERFITAIDPASGRVTLDAPLMIALDQQYGGGQLYRARSVRATECGVESIRLDTEYKVGQETKDTDHATIAIEMRAVENAWLDDVVALHFNVGFTVRYNAAFITILDCEMLDPIGPIKGGYRYGFALMGQYTLVENGYTRNCRHAFCTQYRTRGPNVFLDGVAELSHTDSGPHQRFAIGTLYDNIKESKDLVVQNRGDWGTGHGWAGAQQVFWNCDVDGFIVVQQPPTAQNYAVGCIGEIGGGRFPDMPQGLIESHGKRVEPLSLYTSQLKERQKLEAR